MDQPKRESEASVPLPDGQLPLREPDPDRDRFSSPNGEAALETEASRLLKRFLGHNDVDAYRGLVDLLLPKLQSEAENAVVDEGLLADPLDLASDWFSAVFVDTTSAHGSSTRVVAGARRWVHERVSGLVLSIASNPLPWESGYHEGLAQQTAEQTGQAIAGDKSSGPGAEQLHTLNVAFHRLDKLHRSVLRSADVDVTLPAETATRLGLTEDEVIAALTEARSRLNHMSHPPGPDHTGNEDDLEGGHHG